MVVIVVASAVVWALLLVVVLAACRAAAQGDLALISRVPVAPTKSRFQRERARAGRLQAPAHRR